MYWIAVPDSSCHFLLPPAVYVDAGVAEII